MKACFLEIVSEYECPVHPRITHYALIRQASRPNETLVSFEDEWREAYLRP
jgi:hypothetical protein